MFVGVKSIFLPDSRYTVAQPLIIVFIKYILGKTALHQSVPIILMPFIKTMLAVRLLKVKICPVKFWQFMLK